MEDIETIDDLPILKKSPATDDGLPIFKKKSSAKELTSGLQPSVNGLNPFQSSPENTDLVPVLAEHRNEIRQQQEADARTTTLPTGGGMIPVKLTKPAKVAPQQFTQTNGSIRKDKSWENLGDFVPNTVMGGLQKDLGQAAQFIGDNFAFSDKNPLSRLGARLEGVGQDKQDKAAQYQLPNTTGGDIAATATHFIPDLIELALTPELEVTKLGKLSEVLGKYGTKAAQVATGKFPLLMGTKGLTSGYVEAKKEGASDYDATKAGLIKSAEEYGKGALFEGAGKIASKASDLGKKALEDAGWMADGKIVSGAQKAILNSSAQAAAFSAVPFITNAIEGKTTTLKEMKDNAIFGGILGLFHGSGEKKGDHTAADGAAAQVLEREPLIDLHNFEAADIDAIKEVHEMPENATDLKIKSAIGAEQAFKAETPEEKQQAIVQSSIDGKAASVKSVTDAILEDKQAVIDAIPEDLPNRDEIVAKINDVHKALDHTEQAKTKLGDQILAIDNDISAIPEKSENPVEQAENEVKLETLTKQRDELSKELKSTIVKQQEKGAVSDAQPENTFKQKIANLFTKLKGTSKQSKEVIFDVSPEEATVIKEKTGLEIEDGYKHVIDNFGINHVLSNHGEAKTEEPRGQIPVTQTDFEKIPEILQSPDHVENAGKNKMGRDVIRYIKTFEDGDTYYLEEVRTGKKELALNTMFKTKGRRIYDTPEEVSPYSSTSETASPDANVDNNSQNTTTLRNEEVERKRKEYGFDEPLPRKGATNDELNSNADSEIADGYDTHALMDRVLDKREPITGVESVILAKFQGAKENELLKLNDRVEKSIDRDDISFAELIQQRDKILDDMQRAYKASEASGTIASDALRARQVRVLQDYSLANMLIRKRVKNNGKALSNEQLNEVTENYNRQKALLEAIEKNIAKRQKEENELLAKKAIRDAALENRKENRSVKKEVIDQQIKDVFASLKMLAKEQRSTLSANPIPIEYIPEIAKLVKLYSKKGIITVEGIVDNIYNGLKDDIEGLSKDHVLEYVGLSAEKDPLKAVKTRMRTSITDLKRRTEEGDFSKRKREPIKLDKEGLDLRDALEKARYEYELSLHRDALKNRTKAEVRRDNLTEVMNIPRALMASTDFSAPLRQGLVMTVSHPVRASEAFIHMFKSAASTKTFDRWFYDLKESHDYASMKESKLYIADPHKPELAAKEEQFMTNLANRIPLIGKLVEGSERAYVGYLNKLRVDLFRQSAELFEANGKTVTNSPDLYKGLASWINNATGRGEFKNENVAQALNTVLFSPRLIASRLNLLNPRWYAKLPKEVRVKAIGDMLKFFAVGTSVLALAAVNGAQVETDPISSDFGKIRVGDRRWDIWGGFAQYARLFGQLISGQTKSTTTGKIQDLNQKKFGSRTRADVATSFVRNKLSPVPAYLVNLLAGKDAMGQDFDPVGSIPKNLMPLTIQDTYQAMEKEGVKGLFTTGLPTTFGVGVQSYSDKKK